MIPMALVPYGLEATLPGHFRTGIGRGIPRSKRLLADLGFGAVDVLCVDHPAFAGLWSEISHSVLIYRPTDVYPQFDRARRVDRLERQCVAAADGVLCTGQVVAEHIRQMGLRQAPMTVVENGVDFERFSAPTREPEDLLAIPRPRAVYVGALDGRFDWEVARETASALPGVSLLVIGPRSGVPGPLPANLHLLGPRPYGEIPSYLQACQVGLLPFSAHPVNQGRSPMKFYEYLAAGLPVVAVETEELRQRHVEGVRLCATRQAFIEGVRECVVNPASAGQGVRIAKAHCWKAQAEKVLDFITDVQRHKRGQRTGSAQ